MDNNLTPATLLAQFDQVVAVWKRCPEMALKGVSVEDYCQLAKTFQATLDELADLKFKTRQKTIERDELAERLNTITVRIRSGVHGYFGPDSFQYEQVGCIRKSKRRKPGPKPRRRLPLKVRN
jgi:hypothetical protein